MLGMKRTRKADTSDVVESLPGLAKLEGKQFAGYAPVGGGGKGAKKDPLALFYWFVGTDDYAQRPTILWTNGGPGSSSFWGFFLENGPYVIQSAVGDYPTVKPRATAWNNRANYLIFEHPLGVTLSFAADDEVPKNVEAGIAQLYQALLHVFAKHPEIARNPLILAGESYAGTYLPLLSQAILDGNAKAKSSARIDLRATVLLDAWVDPFTQMASDTIYALTHGLISQAQKEQLDRDYAGAKLPDINSAIQEICGCYMANLAQVGDPPFDPVLLYLNRSDVRKALHVPAGKPDLTDSWSKQVSKNYTPGVNNSYLTNVQALLQSGKLKILVVSGLNDAKDCNFIGTGAWLSKLHGSVARKFNAATPQQRIDPSGNVYGLDQDGGNLTWLKVLNAGHLAVADQPLILDYILEKSLPKKGRRK
jgi:cathepsin A (carboxypeptidase C)